MTAPDFSDRSIDQLVSLEARTAVITGGATGIGLAVARRLLEAGANVLIADLNLADETAEGLSQEFNGRVSAVTMDVTKGMDVSACADLAIERFGGIDIWVNNAGIYPSSAILEMSEDEWDRVHNVNLRGAFLGSREAARRMVKDNRAGVIINMASIAAFRAGGAGIVHYTASKHGLNGLTKALAVELGPSGVRVLTVAPTMVETPGIIANADALRAAGNADLFDSFASRMPLRRVGLPDDVARVVLFAVSDLAGFMTGSTLMVDAGDLAQ